MCKNDNWKCRYAGLMAIATIGEGCHDQMLPILGDIVNGILPFLDDNRDPYSAKVRHAACNAIGQMATDFQPSFQEKFHHAIMNKLIILFSSSENPRVEAHAAAAMVNFLEGCSSFIVKEPIDLIAEKIGQILSVKINELAEKGKKVVLEQTIVTLSSLADSAQEYFINYYDKFFPLLKFIIENAMTPELRLLWGKAIEYISLIGLAVGRDKFINDAGEIMNMLLRTQTGEQTMEADDPQLVYIIASWSRICKILGPDFQPYLPYVMPQILKIASLKIEVTLLDKEDVSEVEENEEVQCLDSGADTFSVKTTGLEEKDTACQMIMDNSF